jgi:predicted nucleotidyltransferase
MIAARSAAPGAVNYRTGSKPARLQAAVEKSVPQAYIKGMRRDEFIAKLKETEPALKAFGVAALYLFGSHARDEAGPNSDVDVFVDPATGKDFGFLPFMDAYDAIKGVIGEKLDYGTRKGLHPLPRADIENDAIRIF